MLAEDGERALRFEGLAYGDYAVAALHDENASGAMDTVFLGIPKEGLGFSNNPRIGFGAPSFESGSVRFDESEMALRLQVRYFLTPEAMWTRTWCWSMPSCCSCSFR